MRALIICAVILLASTQLAKATPVDNEIPDNESISDNELSGDEEYMSELREEVYQALQSFNEHQSEDVNGEGYENANDDEEDDDEAMDVDTMEKTLGIEIPICAQYAELTYPLHLSHLTDCGKFYKCSNGRGYLFDCPSGEQWSVKQDRCDYPELAACTLNGMHQYKLKRVAAKAASDTGDEASDNDEDDEGHDPNGDFEVDPRCEGGDPYKPLHFSHPRDCTKFYKCYMGKAYVIKCPKGQHWGQRLNRCEHPTLARCTVLNRPAPAASVVAASLVVPYMDIEEKHSIIKDADYIVRDQRCIDDAGERFKPTHFAHPTDCQMFYKCFNKQAYKVSCPLGLHYSERTKACDYPEVAKCQSSPVVGVQSAQHNVEMSAIPDCSHGLSVTFGIQGSISRYFQCLSGEAYLRECATGEFFNINVMKCDHLPYDPSESLPPRGPEHIRRPQWPTFTPYAPQNYPSNYYQSSPLWWGMNSNNYPNWQYPMQYPMPVVPHHDEHKVPAKPVVVEKAPEAPLDIPQAPLAPQLPPQQSSPEFPSWLPQLNTNIVLPQLPAKPSKPVSSDLSNKSNGFDFMRGQHSSRCPRVDDPLNPVHLSHETSCTMFYKCFQQRAFLMECPNEQEWSDELQRCDYHMFANCDPTELAKRKMKQ